MSELELRSRNVGNDRQDEITVLRLQVRASASWPSPTGRTERAELLLLLGPA